MSVYSSLISGLSICAAGRGCVSHLQVGCRQMVRMGKPKFLRVCHINARSFLADSCILDLEILCANHNIGVLCISETWLNSSRVRHNDLRVILSGFQAPVRFDRPDGQTGGGVAIYVRRGLSAIPVNLPVNGVEVVCVELCVSSRKKMYVITVSRPL